MFITLNAPTLIDKHKLEKIAKQIAGISSRPWTLMELCSGQTNSFLENGLDQYLPSNIDIVHGPACAVCAAPIALIDAAIELANRDNVILCASFELLRLKGSVCDLLEIKAQGRDVRVVHTPLDSLAIAREEPGKKVVFLSVGFEMAAQSNALAAWQAKRLGLKNYFLLASQCYFPAVVKHILAVPGSKVQGIFGLSSVCSVTGMVDFEPISKRYQVPIVITGHAPTDLLEGIRLCVNLLENKNASVENLFRGSVSRDGNREGKSLIKEVFQLGDRYWRGIGVVEQGGYHLRPEFQQFDAERAFELQFEAKGDNQACISREILLGFKKPTDCPLFGKGCRPGNAMGSTMVSSEGACASYYNFKNDRQLLA
ncbi:hydrogenase formation protein HypD [Candidatus Obscuribacterales bacterium]|nr:hydrogenase formation protein HypD [Candidatus Obscuribacterales bacterium]MBX3136912.1 hydrogenase formation protein HypD [Candidatus Obscuribacterales bacterium]